MAFDIKYLPKEIVSLKVAPIIWPNDADKDGGVDVSVSISASATQEFDDWARAMGVDYSISFESKEDGPVLHFENDEHVLWFKMRWL